MGERFLDHQCGITSHQECIETRGIPRAPAALASDRLVTAVAERAAAKETFESLFPGDAGGTSAAMTANVNGVDYGAVAMGPATARLRPVLVQPGAK